MIHRLALVALAACSWTEAITHDGTTPVAGGPCLQIVHPTRHRWDLYRGATRIGGNTPEAFELATADRPASVTELHHASLLERWGFITAPGMLAGIAMIGPDLFEHDPGHDAEVLGIAGGAVMALSLVVGIALAWRADADEGAAVSDYNAWARVNGCR
jgi:hypothetical protein